MAAADLIGGHFADGACDPVNVEGTVRQSVKDNATSAAVDLFDAAQKQVSQIVCVIIGPKSLYCIHFGLIGGSFGFNSPKREWIWILDETSNISEGPQ